MNLRDRKFGLGALGLTAVVPAALLALAPFDEARASFGTLVGWAVALLIMVPSYVLLSRGVSNASPNGFLRGFMLGMILRLVATVAAVSLFALRVEHAPLRSFLLAFFLGYGLLTGLELGLMVPSLTRRASA